MAESTSNQASGFINPNLIWKDIFSDPEWMFKTGMGGILNACCLVLSGANPIFLPLVLAVVALVCGYLLRVIRTKVANPSAKLPTWNNWTELFISGLSWLVIQIAYVAIIGLIITMLCAVGTAIGALGRINNIFTAWAIISYVIVTAIFLLFAFLTPFIMVNFAVCEQVSAGFDLKTVFARIKENSKVFLLAWILSIGLGWVSIALPAISVVGIFLSPTTVFVAYLFTALLAAQAWGEDNRAVVETTQVPFKVSR